MVGTTTLVQHVKVTETGIDMLKRERANSIKI
jgi:hypothetical protein